MQVHFACSDHAVDGEKVTWTPACKVATVLDPFMPSGPAMLRIHNVRGGDVTRLDVPRVDLTFEHGTYHPLDMCWQVHPAAAQPHPVPAVPQVPVATDDETVIHIDFSLRRRVA